MKEWTAIAITGNTADSKGPLAQNISAQQNMPIIQSEQIKQGNPVKATGSDIWNFATIWYQQVTPTFLGRQ